MEGKFKLKFDTREAYQKGVNDVLEWLNNWKEKDSEFDRDFTVTPDVDKEKNKFNVDIVVSVVEEINS